jgi:predicted HNH restriction endonuclease
MEEPEAGVSDFILYELETHDPPHYPYMKYGDGFRGRQGVYLARLTPDLYAALSTVAAVLPQTPATSEDPKPETAIAGDFAEGERQKRETTFFKRNPKLRREAIRRHGAICIVCKFNFEKRYGEAGKGYIEIHHLNPLAERLDAASGEPIRTNAEDVVPLCANCHRVVHRTRPSMTLDALVSTIRN